MKKIFAGTTPLNTDTPKVEGQLIDFEGEKYYKISNYDNMNPFFMTITSDSDPWMFLSSNGGLTCGRKDRENSLFPYYTDDKIHDSKDTAGPLSVFIILKDDKNYLWQPFTDNFKGAYTLKRNIYKNVLGNKVIFEEVNETLQLSFGYAWKNSDKYGFVKETWLSNQAEEAINVEVVDGLRNILPYGVTTGLQSSMSTLVDGYKKCELIENLGLSIYTLSSILTDKAEPSEALKATVVWNNGLAVQNYLFSEKQLDAFKRGEELSTEQSMKGRRGAYLIKSEFNLAAGQKYSWQIIAEVSQNHSQVVKLMKDLANKPKLSHDLNSNIDEGTTILNELIANADGIQSTADELSSYRHLSNTMFNIMRGGIYYNNYQVPKNDFIEYVESINSVVYKNHANFLNNLPNDLSYTSLLDQAKATNDADFVRIAMEYLPLTFSRRHGDPSRPWNFFQIDVKKEDGSKKLNYQGNWRDIFQNWEALSYSFPHYVEGIIAKFVNASTVDGYNPYRVTKNGIDWEILDPEDPWSNIGYWGDHQIIYLQKLLEVSDKFHSGKLAELLNEKIFVYANVPYRIKGYNDIVKNPYDTIVYDDELEATVGSRFKKFGADGKIVFGSDESPYKANLAEKLLVPLFAKLSNFVPNGGIWLNTQRPEWNDANNALVGYGLSMVTVYYMRRYVRFLKELLVKSGHESFDVSTEVNAFFIALNKIFASSKEVNTNCTERLRKKMVDELGLAGTKYRNNLYKNGFTNKFDALKTTHVNAFFDTVLEFLDRTIKSNKKENGLFHSYNLIDFKADGVAVLNLTDMLEGQVALLGAGLLNSNEVLDVLDSLRKSGMYRADQNSYTLYPNKELPAFLEKNNISADKVNASAYLVKQLEVGNTSIIEKDINGVIHFNGLIKNANQLKEILEVKNDLSATEIEEICSIYFDAFSHREFTGRSGTFFKYEGLGSIYWHMVSKLLLVVQENYFNAVNKGDSPVVIDKLREHYYNIRAGIGVNKNPADYGAFPIDPYSHTPGFAGVQQPGMTGQVKEDLIGRFGELGFIIEDGKISINPVLLRKEEFINGETLEFTYCGVAVEYKLSDSDGIEVSLNSGSKERIDGLSLSAALSNDIFSRNGKIAALNITLNSSRFK
jgi:hypothetical protein